MESMKNVLVLPGWEDSDQGHWQTLWQNELGWRRVQQADWFTPQKADWVATIAAAVRECDEPPILVAHSLGCIAVAHTMLAHPDLPVRAAFLVAPPDLEPSHVPEALWNFRPVPMEKLPFPSAVVASTNDRWISLSRGQAFAKAWGSRFYDAGEQGHISEGAWPEGRALFAELLRIS